MLLIATIIFISGFISGFLSYPLLTSSSQKLELSNVWVVDYSVNTTQNDWFTDGRPRKILFVHLINNQYEEHIKVVRIVALSKQKILGSLPIDPQNPYDLYSTKEVTLAIQLTREVGVEKIIVELVCLNAPTVKKEFMLT